MAEARLTAVVETKGAKRANDELNKISKTSKNVEGNVIRAEKRFKSFGKNASAAIAAVDGPLGGIASRVTALNTLLGTGSAAVTAFAVAAVAASAALAQGVFELDKLNVSLAKSEALIKATGNAAGFTAEQLQNQAQALALTTLASTEQIQKAQGILQTFDKVSRETFTTAISLAQDLATVYGGDAASQATQLGKALQDPIKGITALNRVGVTFSDTQKEQIENFVKGGQTAEAQGVILANLASQVGGAGGAVASGTLAGAFDTTGQVYTEFIAKLANSTGTYTGLISLVNTFNQGLLSLSSTLDTDTNNSVQELVKQRQEIQAELDKFGDLSQLPIFGSLFGPSQAEAKVLQDEINEINNQIGAIQDKNKARIVAETKAVEDSEKKQEEIRNRELDSIAKRDKIKADKAKEAAQRELQTLLNLNNSELEAVNVKEDARLSRLKSSLDQQLINEQEFQAAKTEIELNASLSRDALKDAELEKVRARNAEELNLARARITEEQELSNNALKSISSGLVDVAISGGKVEDVILSVSKSIIQAGVDQLVQSQINKNIETAALLQVKSAEIAGTSLQAGQNAFAATAAIPVIGPAAAPAAATAATAAAGSIGSSALSAFAARAQGGHLNAGQSTTFAEKGELEILTPASASSIKTAQQMRSIMGKDSGGGSNVNLVVIDQSTGSKEFEESIDDDGRFILLIRDTVALDIANGNSTISKSLAGSTTTERRR